MDDTVAEEEEEAFIASANCCSICSLSLRNSFSLAISLDCILYTSSIACIFSTWRCNLCACSVSLPYTVTLESFIRTQASCSLWMASVCLRSCRMRTSLNSYFDDRSLKKLRGVRAGGVQSVNELLECTET